MISQDDGGCGDRSGSARAEGVAIEGYVTPDRRWICEPCYEDFKLIFDWVLET